MERIGSIRIPFRLLGSLRFLFCLFDAKPKANRRKSTRSKAKRKKHKHKTNEKTKSKKSRHKAKNKKQGDLRWGGGALEFERMYDDRELGNDLACARMHAQKKRNDFLVGLLQGLGHPNL